VDEIILEDEIDLEKETMKETMKETETEVETEDLLKTEEENKY
jgi:hypothetical protein